MQPLNRIVDDLRKDILGAAKQINLEPGRDVRESQYAQQGAFHYALKTMNAEHWGPCAFLTRDAILRPDSFTRNYLSGPEIVEDMAGAFFGALAPQVLQAYREVSTPYIVHFRDSGVRDDVIPVALTYLHRFLHSDGQDAGTHTCFDGEGRTIFPDAIIRLESIMERHT